MPFPVLRLCSLIVVKAIEKRIKRNTYEPFLVKPLKICSFIVVKALERRIKRNTYVPFLVKPEEHIN
jgi:hypothetical protein